MVSAQVGIHFFHSVVATVSET